MEGSPLLNSLVSDLEDGTVQELLVAERCTTETDKKDYVIAAAVSSLTLSFCQRLSSPPSLHFPPLSLSRSACVIPLPTSLHFPPLSLPRLPPFSYLIHNCCCPPHRMPWCPQGPYSTSWHL